MSKCIECLRSMSDAEARQFMECRECRRAKKRSTKVRNLSRHGTEEIGRRHRDTRTIGGSSLENTDD